MWCPREYRVQGNIVFPEGRIDQQCWMLLRQQATLIIGNWKFPVTLAGYKLVQNKGRSQNGMSWGKSKEWVNEGRKHRQLFLEVGRWRRGNRLSCSEECLIGWIKIVLQCEWLECLWKKKMQIPAIPLLSIHPKELKTDTETIYVLPCS